jgi:hypothetical protein
MRWLALSVPILMSCLAAPVLAEKPTVLVRPAPTPGASFSMGELTPTPEMWFYEQYARQYQDPKVAVRNNAEIRAGQRMQRLAAMKWYGLSNQRPRNTMDPVHSDYSASWTSGSANYPNRWGGPGNTSVIVTK